MRSLNLFISFFLIYTFGQSTYSSQVKSRKLTQESYRPQAGSLYKFITTDLDSLGYKIPSTERITIDSIAEVGLNIFGKNQVSRLMTFRDNVYPPGTYMQVKPNGDTSYYSVDSNGNRTYRDMRISAPDRYISFESNGDISEYMYYQTDFYDKWVWITFPIHSKVPFTIILIDTTLPYKGEMTHVKIVLSLSYEGDEIFSVDNAPLDAIKIKHTGFIALTSETGQTTTNSSYFDYFSPSIGYFIRQEVGKYKDSTMSYFGHEKMILNYRLR
jgi:hypothetical protein